MHLQSRVPDTWNNYARVYLVRFMTSAIPRSICKRHVSAMRKIGVVILGKAACVVVYSWGRRRINERRALLMYRISVDESRRDSMGSRLCDAGNAANCLYAIRESSDTDPRRMSRATRISAKIAVATYYSWKRDFLNEPRRDSRL